MKQYGGTQDPIWKTFIESKEPDADGDEEPGKVDHNDHKDKDLEHN